ncbi:MAG: hypothetical protein PHF67_00125 [Candidatus Nanoarchaeia archaeon]|nr:hypothetical protein [Candidatus Nanoarchaeia archaeon]
MATLKEIEDFWDREVKPVALKCADGYREISKAMEAEDSGDLERANHIINKFLACTGKVDLCSVVHISEMNFRVEHELCDRRDPRAYVLQAEETLNSPDFYRDVFKGQETEKEEALNLKWLGYKLHEMVRL